MTTYIINGQEYSEKYLVKVIGVYEKELNRKKAYAKQKYVPKSNQILPLEIKEESPILPLEIHKDHQKYNSRYRDDSLDLIEARERVLQRERDGTGIKIPKLI